jgi:hypothetical protein
MPHDATRTVVTAICPKCYTAFSLTLAENLGIEQENYIAEHVIAIDCPCPAHRPTTTR